MLTIDDNVLKSAKISATDLMEEIGIYLYSKNKLSFGQARKLTTLNVLQFQELLFNNNVVHHYGIKELEEDFLAIQKSSER